MRKILKDGRKPEEVHDVLGLRVVLRPIEEEDEEEDDKDVGERACYQAREIILSMWKEVPHRTKDYIANPKPNGYRSLHMAVDVSENGRRRPLMEIQIRTQDMDLHAVGGTASHSLYKAGLTDPQEVAISSSSVYNFFPSRGIVLLVRFRRYTVHSDFNIRD